jgi:hypothetical protein
MTAQAVRRAFAIRAAEQPARLLSLLKEAELPDEVIPLALARLAVRLDGFRILLIGSTPRPPLQDDEVEGYFQVLDSCIDTHVYGVLNELVEQRRTTATRVQVELMAWERTRDAWSDRPTKEAVEAMRDKSPDTDWVRVDLGDGRYEMRYKPRLSPEDAALYRKQEKEARQ